MDDSRFKPGEGFEQGGNAYIDLRVCKECGATVMPRHEDRHRRWHDYSEQGLLA